MNPKKRALAETLLEHIRQGDIVDQGKLPPERTLALMLGEKRPQVREAILILEAWGILDVRDRQGIFLASSEIPEFSSGLEHMMPAPGEMLPEIMEMRYLVEIPAAGFAAARRTREDLAAIRRCMDTLEELAASSSGQDAATGARWNSFLHHAIIRAAHNRVLVRFHEGLASVMERSVILLRSRRASEKPRIWSRHILGQHRKIVQCILDQDAEEAREAMREHLEDTAKGLAAEEELMTRMHSPEEGQKSPSKNRKAGEPPSGFPSR